MRIKLSFKLFGAFFLILVMVAAAMFFLRYLFSLNLRQYIRQVELERLQGLAPVLEAEYRNNNGWAAIQKDEERWEHLIFASHDTEKATSPPRENRRPRNSSRIVLLDAGRQPLIGPQEDIDSGQMVTVAIEVDGQTVGWVGMKAYKPFDRSPPTILLERATRQSLLLGGAVIGLTALFAFLFSRHLLKPIQRLIRGTREVAHRDFSVRIAPTTRDELGQLADHFNAMAGTLEDYENKQRQWLSDISHELRTPLAVLRGEIEAIHDGVREPTAANISSLRGEILRLGKLVDDLHQLSMTEAETVTYKKERVYPGRILETVIESHRPRFERCGIDVKLAADGIENFWLTGDSDRLAQVFTNLLENVCKYVSPPGLLEILGRSDAHDILLVFQDNGPGVPDEALARLFDRLYRVDPSRSRHTGGSGLGLSICRRIIEGHGGTIWAQHSPLGGLSISIRLPSFQTHS